QEKPFGPAAAASATRRSWRKKSCFRTRRILRKNLDKPRNPYYDKFSLKAMKKRSTRGSACEVRWYRETFALCADAQRAFLISGGGHAMQPLRAGKSPRS